MRLRTSPLVLAVLACTASGTMALSTTTVFASSSHHSDTNSTKSTKSTTVVVKGNGNCTVVNSKDVNCSVSRHSHGHGHSKDNGHSDPGLGHGLEDVVAGVGDILGGLLGGL